MNLFTEGVALYRLPAFFASIDTENLFGEDITLNHRNDEEACLGCG